jgi:O-antigen/teichoic acid export membrane protein
MIRNLFKDLFKYLPGQVVPGIVGFISIPIITHLFPPDEYGNYALVMATIGVFSTIVGWLYFSIIRLYPKYERDKKLDEFYGTILKMAFISILLLSFIFSSVLLLLESHISAELWSLMWVGVLVFILISSFLVLIEFFRAKRQISWYSCFKVWHYIAAIGFGIVLIIAFNFGVDGLLWGYVLSLGIAFPMLWIISVGKVRIRSKNISIPLTSEIAKYGFPLVVGNLAAWILSLSDRYFLEFFRSSKEVGIYSASYNIAEHSILLIAALFALTSGSIIYQIWEKEGKKKSQEFVSMVTRYYLIVCIPAVVGLSLLAQPLISIMTAPEYHEGYVIVPFVTLGAFFFGLQQRFYAGINFYKKTHFIMFAIIASCLLNLGLNFLLVPKYGFIAAALTTVVSYAFLLVLMVVISRRFFIWEFPFKSLGKVICASAIMGLVVLYIVGNGLTSSTPLNLIVGICIGTVVYFLMLLLLRELQEKEIQELRAIKAKFKRRIG